MIDPVATSEWSEREVEEMQEVVRSGGETLTPLTRSRSVKFFRPQDAMVSRRLLALIAFLAGVAVGISSCVVAMGEFRKRTGVFRWP